MRVRFALLMTFVAVVIATGTGTSAENLVVNPGFETGPYGASSVTGWTSWSADPNPICLFDGAFDISWNVPPAQPAWPTNYGPFGGSYYLGRYYPPATPSQGWIRGALYQRLTGRTPGETLYAQCWVAAHHPHGHAAGCGARIGLDPTFDPSVDVGPTADTVWDPPSINQIDYFGYTESAYGKQRASTQVGTQGTMTVWVQYQMADNNISEPQVVQLDDVRVATTKAMEINSVYVTGVSSTIASVTWETADGNDPLVTDGYVDYGLTSAYGSTKTDLGKNVHSVNITGLTSGATYHFRIRSSAAGYEEAATADITFVMVPSVKIANVNVTATTGDTATVEWDTTDTANNPLAADSKVEYGYAPKDYHLSKYDPAAVAHHSVTLTGLYPNTRYYYRVESSAAGFNPRRYPSSTTTTLDFTTGAGAFWNGDFETVLRYPRGIDDEIPGWSKVQGRTQWFNNGEWEINVPAGGSYYVGNVTNYDLKNGVIAQSFTTTPGELLSFVCDVYSEGTGDWKQTPCGGNPHRFGEDVGLIGIDPTGGNDPYSAKIVWSARRQTQDWHYFASVDPCTKHAAEWQKVGVVAVATGATATVFLKTDNMWGIGWAYNVFDNVKREAPVSVASVAEAKALGNDTVIDLAPPAAGCPVVTYIASPNFDSGDNNFAPYFYIQDETQPAAIKVTMAPGIDFPTWLAIGKKVKIMGSITWGKMKNRLNVQIDQQFRLDKPCGERVISALSVTDSGVTGAIEAVGLANRDVAAGSSADHWFTNPGSASGVGVNTTGILVRTWGRVLSSMMTQDYTYYLVIDDGSGVPSYSGYPAVQDGKGLCVDTGENDMSGLIGRYVLVTGIAGVRVDYDWDDPSYVPGITLPEAGKNVRWLKARPLTDGSGMPDIVPFD